MTHYRRKALSAHMAGGPAQLRLRPAVPRPADPEPAPRPAKPESTFLRDKIAPTLVTFLVLTVGGP